MGGGEEGEGLEGMAELESQELKGLKRPSHAILFHLTKKIDTRSIKFISVAKEHNSLIDYLKN